MERCPFRPVPVFLFCLLGIATALAADEPPAPATLDGEFASAIVVDAETGLVLVAKDPDERRQPASMTKMMTELLVLERIHSGDISLDDTVKVSARASRMGGSQVYLKHGEEFRVEDLLHALAIHSANDAAVALAEYTAGSVEAFVDLMNLEARDLGMHDTEFHSVHGLPAGRGQSPDLTTARDLATLARRLVHYPHALEWASTKTAPFRDGEFTLYNPNHLIGRYRGLDGLKTGYHGQAGYCVTATAVQQDRRLISVVMGCPSDRARATESTRLLTYGFNLFTSVPVVEPGQLAIADQRIEVQGGKAGDVGLVYAGPLSVSVPRGREADVELEMDLESTVPAPIDKGQRVGRATAVLDGRPLGTVDVLTAEGVEKGNWLDRLFR